METIRCPICGGDSFAFVLEGKDHLHGLQGTFRIVRCRGCSLLLTNPRPTETEIRRYYPKDYASHRLDIPRVEAWRRRKKALGPLARWLDPRATVVPAFRKPSSILEIGCGGGRFLYEYRLDHPGHRVIGTDADEGVVRRLREAGVPAFRSSLRSIDLPSESMDAVLGWMILEHIHGLNDALREVRRVLKKDGWFCFSLPNAGSWELAFFGSLWFAAQVPTHLYHFTVRTAAALLAAHGFSVERVHHQRSLRNVLGSLDNAVKEAQLPGWLRSLFRRLLRESAWSYLLTFPFAWALAAVRQSGRITIVARKHG